MGFRVATGIVPFLMCVVALFATMSWMIEGGFEAWEDTPIGMIGGFFVGLAAIALIFLAGTGLLIWMF
jgi:hypothetical protein